MIEKPTVFVIGAGAGVPFGFPTGATLTEQMQVSVTDDALILRRPPSLQREAIDEFAKAVQRAQPKSIDDFLREQAGFADIGKLLIAHHLSQFERSDALFKSDTKQHWLRELWHEMKAPHDDFPVRNRASFIVFNYDRCVEHFLTNVMVGGFPGVTLEQAWGAIQQIVVHPHGILGDYIPTSIDGGGQYGDGARSFMPPQTPDEAQIAARGIRFFWEESHAALPLRERIDGMLQNAQYVVFLGFGYIESNLNLFAKLFERLETHEAPEIIGSCYKMGRQERIRVKRCFNGKIKLRAEEPVTFFREHVPLHELRVR